MPGKSSQLRQHRPVIGVIACGRAVEGEPAQAVKHRYLEAVERFADSVPLIVPTNQSPDNAAVIVAHLDAILLTGSNSNIAPHRYGSDLPGIEPRDDGRDDFGQALIRAAIKSAKPAFGICRGLQEINVAMGGTLKDLRASIGPDVHHAPPGASLGETFGFTHPIDVVPNGTLHRFTLSDRLVVNSVHYQAVDRLAESLVANATGPEGVVEAVAASATAAPVFAVQWHPEWQPQDRPHDLAFWHYLGEAARATYMPAPGAETAA
ncbi:gamma-glutamyl-gamma-aminobutyrate hydrolase family protein [Devosia sediminis]|uniref:Gamma-glutamyl-gamma-aminobutyrate hydrolase family protein n=1 Tax=Devosia sediminis TaxID=2798801 RepID=A0A934IWU7_9HYPH|nr:gamma-glutamyl-gamma-aminobutyrate hydrolase family protein [Devosia sediminis]MBJ3785827.1 gamma-glutamyl-gamma-aminobutyrate hydrolase family protein [Devosia sediminis]